MLAHALAITLAAAPAASFALDFTAKRPGTVTGVDLRMEFAGDPPVPQRQVDLVLPRGTVVDGSAFPRCEASDAELMMAGPSACPQESRIGGGTLELDTSSPLDPFVDDGVIFNAGDSWTEVFTERRSQKTLAVGHRRVTAPNRLEETLAPTPGLGPGGESAIKRIELAIDPSVVTTPPRCPRSRRWVSRLEFETADGTKHTVKARTPCRRPRRP